MKLADGYELDPAVPLSDLRPHPENPNQGDVGAIVESIETVGFYGTVTAQKPRNGRKHGRILAGEHRWRAAQAENADTIPVSWLDVDDDTALRILLADNQIARLALLDQAAQAAALTALAGTEQGLAGTGSDADDLDNLLRELAQAEKTKATDDHPVPPPRPDAISKQGDVWLLGEHRVMCGDSTVEADVAALVADTTPTCMWTDPPYGVEYVGKTADALTIDNDTAHSLNGLLTGAWTQATRVLSEGSACYIAHPAGELSVVFAQTVLAAGWRFHAVLIWVKDQFVLGHTDYHYRHEPLILAYTPGGGRRGRGGEGWYGDNSADSVFEVPRPKASPDHPTGKPVALIEAHLANSAAPGAHVLDLFGGSGSTLMAADNLGMRALLMEKDPVYCDVSVRRWQNHTGEKPILESTGEPHDFA